MTLMRCVRCKGGDVDENGRNRPCVVRISALVQAEDGALAPPAGWKCAKCGCETAEFARALGTLAEGE